MTVNPAWPFESDAPTAAPPSTARETVPVGVPADELTDTVTVEVRLSQYAFDRSRTRLPGLDELLSGLTLLLLRVLLAVHVHPRFLLTSACQVAAL